MPRPIVLIHGAWHGGWCFDPVTQRLRERNFTVLAPELPFSGAQDDINTAREVIKAHPDAVVLGHSYGGLVITHAASGLRTHRLVYLCAFMPDLEDNPAQLQQRFPTTKLPPAMRVADGRVSIDRNQAAAVFYQDASPELAEAAANQLRSMVLRDMPPLQDRPAWQERPSTYVVCQADQALHPQMQQHLAQRADDVVHWDCGHSPFMSDPDLLANLLAGYAESNH